MIVVADTSPLNYLIQIGCIDLLFHIYERIVVPSGVLEELSCDGAPASVRLWAMNRPDWIEVRLSPAQARPDLALLDKGEREAIQIALELRADRLLLDEIHGRREAQRLGLSVTGTLGVLLTAGTLELIDPETAYRRLVTETNFRASPSLESQFLALIHLHF